MVDILDKIYVGKNAYKKKKITKDDIIVFSKLSGDKNPLHLNDNYSDKTIFKKPIAHGMISASLFSGIFGTKLPGEGSLYISQNLKFINPVYANDIVQAKVTIKKIVKKYRWVYFNTLC